MSKKAVIEGRTNLDGYELLEVVKKLLGSDDEYPYLQGNQYIIIEVVENE